MAVHFLTTSTEVEVTPSSEAPRRRQRAAWDGRVTVTFLTVAALGIRLLVVRGFWLDEATSGYDARLSYAGMLHQLGHDNHPPLEYTILWLVAHSLGSTQTDLRLPSIAFGTLLVPMLFLAGRALYNERVGVLAAAFGTVGPLAVWYAQEARMYALFMLLATVSIWAQRRALATDRPRFWLAWGAASCAMFWNQWFGSLAIGAEVLFFGWVIVTDRRHRPCRRPLLHLGLACSAIAVSAAPLLPLLREQYANNQATGLGFTSPGADLSPIGIFNNVVWATFGYHSTAVVASAVAIWPLGLLAILAILGRGRGSKRANRQLLVVALVPMGLMFLAGAATSANRSIFEIRYFIEFVPALYLLLAAAAWNLTPGIRGRRIFVGATLGLLSASLVLQQTDSANPRLYGYDAAFRQIRSVARPGAELLYAPAFLNVDVAYFAPHLHAVAASTTPPDVALSDQIFVFGSFDFAGVSSRPTALLVRRLSTQRHLQVVFRSANVIVWEFS